MTDEQYYNDSVNWGSYQYVPLNNIVNNFLLMYVGSDMQIPHNTPRYNILFHAKRGIQELNYDGNRNVIVLERTIDHDLKFVLPPDYVNYVKVSRNVNGQLLQLFESPRANRSFTYQLSSGDIVYDSDGQAVLIDGELTTDVLDSASLMWSPYNYWGWFINDQWYFPQNFVRYGLNTEEANSNGTFRVDKTAGVIDFGSGLSGASIVLEYISDGLSSDDGNIVVNKLAEEYLYMYIKWALMNGKANVPEYAVARARKDKMAALRNAKIRLSNMHSGRLLMTFRGQDKWIK